VEQVCSGIAIPDLFDFLQTRLAAPAWLLARMAENGDRTPLIIQAAIDALDKGPPCDIAIETMRLFTDILADEAANLALKMLSLGGLYLGGGLSARIGPFLEPERFMATFSRGVYRELLDQIPIRIILNPDSALLGAAFWGFGKKGAGTPPLSNDSSTPPQDT
jgi:glucokinase